MDSFKNFIPKKTLVFRDGREIEIDAVDVNFLLVNL